MVVFELALELSVFLIIGIIIVKLHVVEMDFAPKLTKLMMDLILPCLIINTLGNAEREGSGLTLLLIIGVGTAVVFMLLAIGTVIFKLMGKTDMARSVRFATIFGNFSFVGMPVTESLYGAEGLFIYTILTLPLRFFYYAFPPFIMDPNRGGREKLTRKELMRQFCPPPVIAIAIGLLMYFTGFRLPGVLNDTVKSIAGTCFPLGMILCGMPMAEMHVKDLFRSRGIWIMVLSKNFIAPLFTLLLMLLLPIDADIKKVVVMSSSISAPALLTTFVIKYCGLGEASHNTSAGVFATIIVAIGTMPMWAAIVDKLIQ